MTPAELQAATGCGTFAVTYAAHLGRTMAEYAINTPARQAAFLAQIGHESAGFRHTRELWGPTPAQRRYEGRADLGNTEPGDGRRFLGRGLIQITGRTNYTKCARALGLPLLERPELLEAPEAACRSAGWYWSVHGLNRFADTDQFGALTRAINGGYNGLDDRIARWLLARRTLGL